MPNTDKPKRAGNDEVKAMYYALTFCFGDAELEDAHMVLEAYGNAMRRLQRGEHHIPQGGL